LVLMAVWDPQDNQGQMGHRASEGHQDCQGLPEYQGPGGLRVPRGRGVILAP